MIIHLTRISPNARRIFIRRNATIPEDFIGPAALPLFCLAPHGVFRASRIAPRAVSSYLAFSPLPALFSKNRRYVFCDTFRQHNFSTAPPAYFTRHAAVWCSDFPPANPANAGLTSDHLPSAQNLARSVRKERKWLRRRDAITKSFLLLVLILVIENPVRRGRGRERGRHENVTDAKSKRRWNTHQKNRNHR